MMEIEYVKINELKPYERNAKMHSAEQVDYIANSIKEFGWQQPVVIDSDNVIVIGHGRVLAAKKLGIEEAPCVRASELTKEQIKALRLADNKTNESEWDSALLDLDMLDLGIDMSMFGFESVEEEFEKKQDKEKMLKSMELKAFEHYDYIVFVFKNQMDWLNAVNAFGLERVDAGYGKTKKVGIGRVLDGARLLEKIGYKNSDTQQRESEVNIDNRTASELD